MDKLVYVYTVRISQGVYGDEVLLEDESLFKIGEVISFVVNPGSITENIKKLSHVNTIVLERDQHGRKHIIQIGGYDEYMGAMYLYIVYPGNILRRV